MRSHPREKLGRNDPCPCGSGRKYKHCCLKSEAAPVPVDTPWQRQREASDRLTGEMMRFAARKFGDQIYEVWQDFNQDDEPKSIEEFPPEERQIFMPYFLFDWHPAPRDSKRGGRRMPGAVAQAFLEEKAKRLSPLERTILEQALTQPVSFYEVLQVTPGRGMVLRDVLIGGESEVEEHSASRIMRAGDLAYGQLCPLPEVTTLGRLAPLPIPPARKANIVKLRAALREVIAGENRALAAEDLIFEEEDIRGVYLDIRDAMSAPPRLTNTDGDPLEFHTLTFQIGSAQAAFDALAPLAWGQSKEELLEDAEVDEDGVLRSAEIPWITKGNAMHKTWDNTVLGNFKISGRSLVAEVNSANRAKNIRQKIEERLGILAVHQSTRVQTQNEMLKAARRKATSADVKSTTTLDSEAIEHFQAKMQQEMLAWVDTKIPILNGRTPRQAIKDPDGREIVEGLLLEMERRSEGPAEPGIFHPDVGAIRKLLKLTS